MTADGKERIINTRAIPFFYIGTGNMGNCYATMRDFLVFFLGKNNVGKSQIGLFKSLAANEMSAELLEDLCAKPFAAENIIELAKMIADKADRKAEMQKKHGLEKYFNVLRNAHALFLELWQEATRLGISVSLQEVDVPVTIREVLARQQISPDRNFGMHKPISIRKKRGQKELAEK